MNLNLRGRAAVVCGASDGIGKAVAATLAAEGTNVLLCAREVRSLERCKQEILAASPESHIEVWAGDLLVEASAQQLIAYAITLFGTLEILVNCLPGPAPEDQSLEQWNEETWQRALTGKLLSYIRMMSLTFPIMRDRRWGRIVNVLGLTGREPTPSLTAAGVVNAALMNYTKAFATAAAPYNVLAVGVNPGFVDTARYARYVAHASSREGLSEQQLRTRVESRIPVGRPADPCELARVIVFFASDCSSYVTGTTITVDGGAGSTV